MNRLFITGIPASGKSYLANRLAEATGGEAYFLDDLREELGGDERYKKWVNFYLDQDEKFYYENTNPDLQWKNLVSQSEAIWPAFLEKINSLSNKKHPIIFECVNILPHLAKQDLDFPGIVLIGDSYENILKRNTEEPRWGNTIELQKLEAKNFFEVERPHYRAEAIKYGYPIFETADEAFTEAIKLLNI
ncbi:MAG: hypothetical protein KGJ35_00765 [Patescibacteria group bacterium]|nr:hypothetical protein [Patescibacteria group bacterium]